MSTNSISNTTEDAIMNLIFCATAWTDYAINHTTTPQTNIEFALHSADPADAGTSSTSVIVYTGYAKAAVNRTNIAGGFNASASGAITPRANIDFPAGTGGGPGPATFFSSCHTGADPQPILWRGDISPTITVGNGITPRLTTATSMSID